MKINYSSFFIILIIPFFLMNWQLLKGQSSVSTKLKADKSTTTTAAKINWTSNPFDHQVFIENEGQFTALPSSDKILYGALVGNVYMFITPQGLIYKYTENPVLKQEPGKAPIAVDPDDIDWSKTKPIDHYLTVIWVGSKGATDIVAGEEQTYYYTYPGADGKSTIKVNVFKTITCRNVYPGIDIKYTFPEGKNGFKYALIVHPGADLSQIKLQYDRAGKMQMDKNGNVQLNSGWGTFTDHALKSYYEGESDTLASSYKLQNNTESFFINNLDPTKTLIIDPWSTNWTSSYTGNGGYNGAYDLGYDNFGNVYISGSYNPWQIAKYNSAGKQLWTFNVTNIPLGNYGAFCVDRDDGCSYEFEGYGMSNIDKVSTTGALLNTLNSGTLNENWRAAYDECSHRIVIAGGGINLSLQAATIDTLNSNCVTANVLGLPPGTGFHDMCLMGLDPIVDTVYMASCASLTIYKNIANNLLLRVPMPNLIPAGISTYDGFNFNEIGSVAYVPPVKGNANGMNGMTVSPNWVYIYNGDTLRQIDKNTGAINNSISL